MRTLKQIHAELGGFPFKASRMAYETWKLFFGIVTELEDGTPVKDGYWKCVELDSEPGANESLIIRCSPNASAWFFAERASVDDLKKAIISHHGDCPHCEKNFLCEQAIELNKAFWDLSKEKR